MKTCAIIPAAGQGKRFGATKQFQILAGKPVLLHTLEVFEACPVIDGICLVVPETELDVTRDLAQKNSLRKIARIVAGGKERQDSVKNGFRAVPPCDLIVVHDGIRLFVTSRMIEKTVHEAEKWGGCVVGLPVKETTKRIDREHFVRETVDRSTLWSVQTPQAFQYKIFEKALQKAEADHFLGTDEAMLVERIGVKVKVIEGSPFNIKMTTPEDLKIAESIYSFYRGDA